MAEHSDIIIIGAGFAGLGLGIQLKRLTNCNFLILERGPSLGGTWFYNSYPGAACDVPSLAYSYSFAQNPNWSKAWARHDEILAYMKNVTIVFLILDCGQV